MSDERYSVQDASDYYNLESSEIKPRTPLFGICDEVEGGYIAFVTDVDMGQKIVNALVYSEQ